MRICRWRVVITCGSAFLLFAPVASFSKLFLSGFRLGVIFILTSLPSFSGISPVEYLIVVVELRHLLVLRLTSQCVVNNWL